MFKVGQSPTSISQGWQMVPGTTCPGSGHVYQIAVALALISLGTTRKVQ